MFLRSLAALTLVIAPESVEARNILITDDDGLSGNVKALYEALKAGGHDVIVSVPCTNQSGMGAAVRFMRPLGPLTADCRNGAARAGEAGAGPMSKPGFERDWFYVDGTPVMATLYGIDVAAVRRWGKAPDLVLSGPNEGQNVGKTVISSGTVSNVQYAAGRGIPAIALSAGLDTGQDPQLANPKSAEVATRAVELVDSLEARAKGAALLPPGVALNVNFPDRLDGARWKLARIGTYDSLETRFVEDIGATPAGRGRGLVEQHLPGVVIGENSAAPTAAQKDDEAVVYRKDIAVSVMQVGYDHSLERRRWLTRYLRGFLSQ